MKSQFKKNIKITLEYNNRTVTTDMKPYQKISEIKTFAKNAFYPLQQDISYTYQNQDLSQFDSFLIGDQFAQKTFVRIKLVPKIKKRELRVSDKTIEENDPKKKVFACYCGKYFIANYCRNCKKFICNHCKISKEHETHKTIFVNTNNFIESIKTYANTLKDEITSNIEISKKYYSKFQVSSFIETSSWKEIIQRKYDLFYERYENLLNKYKIGDINEEKIKEFINESQNDKEEINNVLNLISENSKKLGYKMSIDEFHEFYDNLSNIEDKISHSTEISDTFVKNYEITEKFNAINKEIEKILDFALKDKSFLKDEDEFDEENDIKDNNSKRNDNEEEYENGGEEEQNNENEYEDNNQNNSQNETDNDNKNEFNYHEETENDGNLIKNNDNYDNNNDSMDKVDLEENEDDS